MSVSPAGGSPALSLIRDGVVAHTVSLERGALTVGRAPDNDLVLADETLSWHHAEFWHVGAQVYVRDRGSTHGTTLNGWPVRVPLAVRSGDTLMLGKTVQLQVIGLSAPVGEEAPVWLVEDLNTKVCQTLEASGLLARGRGDGLRVGPGAELSLTLGGACRPLTDGQPFEWSGRRLRLLRGEHLQVQTAKSGDEGPPFRLSVTLDGSAGPEAVLERADGTKRLIISAENRATLLYVMARRLLEDRQRRRPAAQAGWCTDEELACGVWGREGARMDINGLHVLVYRLRKDLESGGFDPSFLEKRRKAMRIGLLDVQVT